MRVLTLWYPNGDISAAQGTMEKMGVVKDGPYTEAKEVIGGFAVTA
ncbi:MAG: hypothetical protein ABI338_01725 [Gemmatimonadaceae bacterium]